MLVVALAPVLAAVIGRVVRVPQVVIEILLGIVAGPSLLGWIQSDSFISTLSRMGAAMLFFLAGYEIDLERIKGRPLGRAFLGWGISIAVGIGLGLGFASSTGAGIAIGICLASTALGTIMPVLRDAGEVNTSFGMGVIAAGTAGQFGPLLALALFLGGRHPFAAAISLAIFGVVAGVAYWLAQRGLPPVMQALVTATLRTSGQFAVRLVVAIVASLAIFSIALGLDMLLGAFVAGLVGRIIFQAVSADERTMVESKLEAVGFGLLVPVFFVQTGVNFDLRGLLDDSRSLLLLPLFVILLLVVRGIPSLLSVPDGASRNERIALLLFASTGLAIIVAVANNAVAVGDISSATAAALIGAGMISVLVFPLVALAVKGTRTPNR